MQAQVDRRVWRDVSAVFVLCALSWAVYSNTLHSPFVFDDFDNIVEPSTMRLTQLSPKAVFEVASRSQVNRCLAYLTFAFNYYFGRYDVTGYHVVNIALHCVNGVLVYFLALSLFGCCARLPRERPPPAPAAFVAAAVFLAHPIQTQSVTYIVQRMNSLAAVFYLIALLFFIYGRRRPAGWGRGALWTGAAVAWVLALGSKETAVVLPATMVLCEWYFFRDLERAWVKKNWAYPAAVVAAGAVATVMFLGTGRLDYSHIEFTMWQRLLTEFRVVVFYMSLVVYPHPARLNLIHAFPLSLSPIEPWTTAASFLFLCGFAGLAAVLAPRRRLISFCILWFFLHLVVESSILNLDIIFEHRLYLPLVGPAILAAALLWSVLRARWAVPVSGVLILVLAAAAHERNRVWRDPLTLWSDVVSKNPGGARAQNNLGVAFAARDRLAEAVAHYRAALRLSPSYAGPHYNLGVALRRQERFDEALSEFHTALRLDPRHAKAHYEIGLVRGLQGKSQEAIAEFRQALRLHPDYAKPHHGLGVALARQGKTREALAELRRALSILPDYAKAHCELGLLLDREGRTDEAIGHLREAARLDPGSATAHSGLGVALAREGRFDEAMVQFSEALRLDPQDKTAAENRTRVMRMHDETPRAVGERGP